jgi:hypothetical protein
MSLRIQTACPKFDMVWLYLSPIPAGGGGGNFLVQMISTSLPSRRGTGVGVGSRHPVYRTEHGVLVATLRTSENLAIHERETMKNSRVKDRLNATGARTCKGRCRLWARPTEKHDGSVELVVRLDLQ